MTDPLLWSRRLVKTTVANMVGPFLRSTHSVVVGYHRVVERFERERTTALQGSLVSLAMLERHLDWLGRRHRFVTLDELTAALGEGRQTRQPLAALTFDDGYRDVYENAFPLLMRKGIPAAAFLVTDLVGTERVHLHDLLHLNVSRALTGWANPTAALTERLSLAGLSTPQIEHILGRVRTPVGITRAILTSLPQTDIKRVLSVLQEETGLDDWALPGCRSMTWDMVTEMHRAGMTIGSHTRSHAWLTNESSERVREEIEESRRELERRLGAPAVHFAYPDGRFNQSVLSAARSAGYRYAFTACAHRDRRAPLLTIPRRILWEHAAVDPTGQFSPRILQCQEYGWLTGRRACTWQSHA